MKTKWQGIGIGWVMVSLGLWWLGTFGVPTVQASQQSVNYAEGSDRRLPLPENVKIESNKATPNFPDKVSFELKAVLPENANYEKVELNFRLRGTVGSNIRTQSVKGKSGEVTASFEFNSHEDYVPPGTGIDYFWTFYDTTGKAYDTATQNFVYNDERFGFRELNSGTVTVRWYQGDNAFGQTILDKAVQTIDRLNQKYGVRPKDSIVLTVYADYRAMFTALEENTAEWVGGQARPELGTIVLAIAPGNVREVGRTVPHEITHMVVYQATKNPYNYAPKWLDEGLAVLNQESVDSFLTQAFQKGYDSRTLRSLRVLGSSFPADSQQSYQSYGESINAVQYIIRIWGEEKLGQFLKSFSQGISYDEASQAAFGLSLDELDRKWKEGIGYPVPPAPEPPVPTAMPNRIVLTTPTPSSTFTPLGTVAPTVTLVPPATVAATVVAVVSSPVAASSSAAAVAPVAPTPDNSGGIVWFIVGIAAIVGIGIGVATYSLTRAKR